MNKQLGEKILLVLAAVMVMILLSSFKTQNEGDRSLKKIVLNKNKSFEYTVDVGKMGLLKYWLEPNVISVALRFQTEDDTWYTAIVGGGFAQIINNRVTVLADSIEKPEDIDLKRAQDAKERAEEQLRQKQSQQEYYVSKASLARAMARMKAARDKGI